LVPSNSKGRVGSQPEFDSVQGRSVEGVDTVSSALLFFHQIRALKLLDMFADGGA
jgi:hypothetical protein